MQPEVIFKHIFNLLEKTDPFWDFEYVQFRRLQEIMQDSIKDPIDNFLCERKIREKQYEILRTLYNDFLMKISKHVEKNKNKIKIVPLFPYR